MFDYSLCQKCGQSTTLDDYYKNAHGKPTSKICKTCTKEHQRNQKRFQYDIPFHQTELGIINILKGKGIPCVPGKMVRHSLVDVIAWGCVLIECKSSSWDGGRGFLFGFTPRQNVNGVRAHLTVLRCDYGDGNESYHVFPSNHAVFHKEDGTRKHGVHYQPYAAHRKTKPYEILTEELMNEHRDRWDMIEQYRIGLSKSIANGEPTWLSDWRVK